MMMMVVAVEGGLVKICVNVACWEKVIGNFASKRLKAGFQGRRFFHNVEDEKRLP